ncbi:SAGA-associated factor [Boothiomyces sp. JEL0838]|nr:SAGA-associated factor [Boothiomyces sp. JEL0838]
MESPATPLAKPPIKVIKKKADTPGIPKPTVPKPPSLLSLLPSHQKDSLVNLIYDDISADCIMEIIFDVKKKRKAELSVCKICSKKCKLFKDSPNEDVYGQDPNAVPTEKYDCPQCGNAYPAARYAPHLEKCLGLGGTRNSRSRNGVKA